jgi:fatty-acyl-CoA synthase
MDYPLTLVPILERAGKLFRAVGIIWRRPDRSVVRYTYADFYRRARALAEALTGLGLRRGDRVATLMWNHASHLEAYFGVPVAGGVVHTLNLRLHPAELAYIVNHARDRFLLLDDTLQPLYEKFRGEVKLERVAVVPTTGAPVPTGYDDYETLLARTTGKFTYPALEENEAAALCYTSGTTGKPKGVLYSHRALVLHSFALGLRDVFGIAQSDVVAPIVPMFHANQWGFPFASTMMGATQVFLGSHFDPESALDLFSAEQATLSGGVPTIWLGILDALEKNPGRWRLAPGLRMAVAGSAAPESLLRRMDREGMRPIQLWGMTETTPLGSTGILKRAMLEWPEEARYAVRLKQGLPAPFVEARVVALEKEQPWDGSSLGELQVRGPWVASSYLDMPETHDRWTHDGWFSTGDVASIDPEGYIRIADRSKDMIKSGGEWISSVDLENALMGHPGVREAAVIAVPHPKWQERPLAVVVPREGMQLTEAELRAFLEQRFARWQLPDAFVFEKEIPRTSAGKFLKARLRDQFANWKWER